MGRLINAGRIFYALGIIAISVQQFFYAGFRPVILPPWPFPIPGLAVWVYLIGSVIFLFALAILIKRKALEASLCLGAVFLIFFLLGQIPYQIFYNPYAKYFGTWTDPIKELALSGGAFILAGSWLGSQSAARPEQPLMRLLKKMIPLGRIFFSAMLISFGIDHFLYVSNVVGLVPAWIPGQLFWTYFAGVALIGGGLAILFSFQTGLAAFLTATMIFLWLFMLHIPRAIADPYGAKGNEVTSVFEALAFSGIAFVIAGMFRNKNNHA